MFAYKYSCMSLDSRFLVPGSGASTLLAKFAEILFEFCFQCDFSKPSPMPAIPQGAFAACKVREREMKIAKLQAIEQEQEKMFYSTKLMELSPLKYNSKLMNSIWGLYNKYSVHNFKKITDAESVGFCAGSQLTGYPVSVDRPSAGNKGTKTSPVLVSEWVNIWGSHKSY